MTSLFFIGCSATYGDDLDSPATESWPAVIAATTNSIFENHAVSGGTNERTLYHTIKNSDRFDHYYIAWTFISRFTRYRKDNNFEINFNQQLVNKIYGNDLSYSAYGKIHYQYWFNELFAFKIWLQQIILLQSFFSHKKISYTMLNTTQNNIPRWTSSWNVFNDNVRSLVCFDSMGDDLLYNEHLEIQKLVDNIDKSRFLGWGEWSIIDSTSQFPRGPTDHPLAEGHRHIAEYVLKNDPKTKEIYQ